MIYINASLKDAIERIAFLVKYCKEIPNHKKTIEYDLKDTNISLIKEILCENDLENCRFSGDNCLLVTLPLSSKEIAKRQKEEMSCARYWVERLIKWQDVDEKYNLQIEQYLQKYADKYVSVIAMLEEQKKLNK